MAVLKRYVPRLFISIKYITANVVDRNNGSIVATASTAVVVGEVLAMRVKVEGPEDGGGRGIHVVVGKEIEKKGLQSRTKVWGVVNAMRSSGVKLMLEDGGEGGIGREF
uniref:Ribosomal protein L18 n=1 Tax=Kalanchoe fedtschenkoi TaxID=63787 RepID=A0A7N0TL80_KALFE